MAWRLAQMNVATARWALDDARMQGFMDRLDDINAIADGSPGFVWRLQTESGNSTDVRLDDNPRLLLTLSLWESVDALKNFVYQSGHVDVMRQRRDWFEAHEGPYQVLWWVAAGTLPDIFEGRARLTKLRRDGPGPLAFTFREPFDPPEAR